MHTLFLPNTSNELLRVNTDDIVYIQADSNYCTMHLIGGTEQNLWFNLKHFGALVNEQLVNEIPTFIGVGRSLVINRNYVYRINPRKGELVLYGGGCKQPVPLHASVVALEELWKAINRIESKRIKNQKL